MRRLAWTLVLATAVAAGAAEPSGPTVRNVAVRNVGPGRLDESFVRSHLSARPGAPLDRKAVARDVRDLLDTERFSDVAVKIEEQEDGVGLVFALQNRVKLVDVPQVSGAGHFRRSRIREWLDLHPGDLVDDHVVGTRVQRVLDEYREDFFADAEITWSLDVTDRAQGLARLSLEIDEGERTRVQRVVFRGNQAVSTRVLEKTVRQPAWWNPFRWLLRGRYDSEELELAKLRIQEIYRNRGYLDVAVDVHEAAPDPRGRLTAVIAIEEGTAYRFGRLDLEGVSLFPEQELRKRIAARPGDVASMQTLRNSMQALRDYYGARGYVHTVVDPRLDPRREQGIVDVRFAVREGNLVHVRNVIIRGNTRTKDKVIRRELLVYPGDIYNEVKVERSERRISNLGFFGAVRTHPESTPSPDEKDLVVEVEEKRTGQFMMGAGFSSIEKVIGYVEISQGNFDLKGWPYFTGGGQKLRLRTQVGSEREDYELSFVEPWFLDRKLSLGFDLYMTDVSYDDYDLERAGGAVTLGKALPGPNRISVRYRLESSRIEDIEDTNQYFYVESPERDYYFTREEDRVTSSLRVTLKHDTRNNPFFPSRGNKVSLFGELAGGIMGFDTDTYSLGIKTAHYVPLWWGHVLGFRTRYEIVDAYGGTDEVPIGDRLFIGGGRTVRGYDYRDVGPKVFRTVDDTDGTYVYHKPVGGKSLALAGAEYTMPLVPKIRLAAFYDMGNVWSDAFELHPDDLATSAGVGIRLDMPGFPIRVDRAWDLEKDDELTDTDPWVIWIGYDI